MQCWQKSTFLDYLHNRDVGSWGEPYLDREFEPANIRLEAHCGNHYTKVTYKVIKQIVKFLTYLKGM